MPDNPAGTRLSDNQYVPLVIRFLIDKEGNLHQGEIVDLNEETVGLFRQLDELPSLISAWLITQTGQVS